MAYATREIMIVKFGQRQLVQLTDRAVPPTDVIDETVLAQALRSADQLVDGYVSARYDLPLAQVPELLVDVAADIARYKLYVDQVPEEVATRYRDAIRTLEAVQAGRIKIDTPIGVEPPPRDDTILMEAPDRQFSRQGLRGF